MVYLRYVGRCLLLLLLAAVGGLVAHITVTDITEGNNNQGVGALVSGGSHPVHFVVKMHMRPVPVREFQARLRTVRNKFDLLRIFLVDKDISDESLLKMLDSSFLVSPSHSFLHSDVKRVSVTSSIEIDDALITSAPDSDLLIDVSKEEDTNAPAIHPKLQNESDPKPQNETSMSNMTKSNQRNDIRKDVQTSDAVSRTENRSRREHLKTGDTLSLLRGQKPTKDLSKSDVSLSGKKSPSVDTDVSEDKLVTIDSKNTTTMDISTQQTDVSKNIPTSPKTSDVKIDDVEAMSMEKREEMTYDDDDYPEDEEDDVNMDDYFDGEVEYYNDAPNADALLEELEEVVHAISEMDNNPQALCRDPRPQVLFIEDPKKQNRQFFPECTVVHRCRNDSGCCGRNYECGPKTEQVIIRTFLAVHVNTTTDTILPDSRMVERISLVNHTECECREKPRLPECSQTCPGVFRMYRLGSQCVCDCVSSSNERFPQCDDVKDGLHPLSHDDLVCIKSGKCGQPRCSIGQFDVSSGFCPIKDLQSIPSHLLRHRLRHQHHLRQHKPSKTAIEGSGDF